MSKIEWTEKTWNPVRGCTKISPGCKNCYAAVFAERWRGIPGHAYEQGFDLRLVPEALDVPLRRRKPTTYFVNSMSDLFHPDVPFDFIAVMFGVMAACQRHTFQLLTKRTERELEFFQWLPGHIAGPRRVPPWAEHIQERMDIAPEVPWPLPNVWLGVSVEDRKRKTRIDDLRQLPAAVRFLSCEPLLEDLGTLNLDGIHWVIIGGESGRGARACYVQDIRSIVQQCEAAGVAAFVKQLGARPTWRDDAVHQGGLFKLDDSKGGDMYEWPTDLCVREWPYD